MNALPSDLPVVTLGSLPRSSAFITIEEAAQVLGVSYRTVRRLIRSGKLKHKRIGHSSVRIAWDWLLEYAATPDARPAGRRIRCS